MKPPVSSCSAASVRRCATQCAGVSTWPYIIVEVVGRPTRCAVRMISSQVAVGSLPLVSTQRTSSSRISAAVPGTESSPASFAAVRKSRERQPGAGGAVDDLHRARTRAGGCRAAASSPRGPGRSTPCPGRSGWMPPCMQISVAPAAHASSTRSPTCCHRQRVGVGVGAPLGERAEPAAGVADVGEVDVPVHDVGDVVAVDVGADGVGQRAQGLEVGAVGAQQRQVLGVGQPGRVAARRAAARRSTSRSPAASAVECPSRADVGALAQLRPVAVDGVEVAAPVRRSARRCRPRRAGRPGPTTSTPRPAPATAARPGCRSSTASPSGPASANTCGRTRGSSHGSGCSTYGGWAASRSRSSNPASADQRGELVDVRPRPLGVDVVGRQRRDPAPVVDAGPQQQPELGGVRQVRRRLHPRLRAEQQPGDRDGGDVLLQLQVVVRLPSPSAAWPGSSGR